MHICTRSETSTYEVTSEAKMIYAYVRVAYSSVQIVNVECFIAYKFGFVFLHIDFSDMRSYFLS